jgi:sugar phosphate isomerase/epimerase
MRLSCGDHSFVILRHELALDIIAGLGFDGVNLIIWGGHSRVQPDEVRADIAGWAGRLDERVRSRGLEIADVVAIPSTDFTALALNHPDAVEREHSRAFFSDMLELTARLGANGLTILPGVDWMHETHEASLARSAQELARRIVEARDRGVPCSIEPHLGSVCQTPEDVARLCDVVPGLELTLDYTHFIVQGFSEADVDPLIRSTRHLHVRGGNADRIQASNAENTIDHARVIGVLAEQDYDGYVAIEFLWSSWEEGMNDIDVLAETTILKQELEDLCRPSRARDESRSTRSH